MSTAPSQPPLTARIIGRYMLCSEIATGGMASVHVGRLLGPVGFSRTVAIKRLHAHLSKDPEFVAMFLDEARLAARIRHRNVVSVLDVVAMEGELFLVMDFVHGESLSKLMATLRKAGEQVPIPIAVAIVSGTLHGLHAAHEAKSEHGNELKIVHRDMSPQNILVGTDGVACVVDFGVASAAYRVSSTQEGNIKGKLAYMSPEQIQLQKIDRRADIYAVSVVLWELLTGARLFTNNDPAAVIARVQKPEVSTPSRRRPEIPPALDSVVAIGLAPKPDARYATALEMAEELEAAVAPASPTRVGAWVRAIAAEQLNHREVLVARIESRTSEDGAVESAAGLAAALSADESTPWSQVQPPPGLASETAATTRAPSLADAEPPAAALSARDAQPSAPDPKSVASIHDGGGQTGRSAVSAVLTIPPPLARHKKQLAIVGAVLGLATVGLIGALLLRRGTTEPPNVEALPGESAPAAAAAPTAIPSASPAPQPAQPTAAPVAEAADAGSRTAPKTGRTTPAAPQSKPVAPPKPGIDFDALRRK